MDFNSTIDLIIKDLEEARSIIDDLKKYPGVPVLQAELARAKCKSAADVIGLLKEIQPGIKKETGNTEPDVARVSPETTSENIAGAYANVKNTEILEIEPEAPGEIVAMISPETPLASSSAPAGTPSVAEASIVAEKFGAVSGRINEEIGSHRSDDDLAGRAMPLTSLRDAIGINDRFLYIREIFNGDSSAFSSALSKLELVNTVDEARALIAEITGTPAESEASRQLLDLVRRKVSHHG